MYFKIEKSTVTGHKKQPILGIRNGTKIFVIKNNKMTDMVTFMTTGECEIMNKAIFDHDESYTSCHVASVLSYLGRAKDKVKKYDEKFRQAIAVEKGSTCVIGFDTTYWSLEDFNKYFVDINAYTNW